MNERATIECVAAGLRRMDNPPDYFLCESGGDEYVWGKSKICGIPVLHGGIITNTTVDLVVPFIPVWKLPGDYIVDQSQFNRGYAEMDEGYVTRRADDAS